MSKKRGSAAERELLHMFCDHGFSAIRVAGSGSMAEPSCDLLVGNGSLMAAIECKLTRQKKKYITKEQMNEFVDFSKNFGLTGLIAVKFVRKGWWFISPERMDDTGKNFAISLEDIKERGMHFNDLMIKHKK
ncbi:Holliday junction resolvase Hjc [Nanoarchaeota archaeon]